MDKSKLPHKLSWAMLAFRHDVVFRCEDYPATYYWLEEDSHCLRIGETLYKMPRKKGDRHDLEKVEKFLAKQCEKTLAKINAPSVYDEKSNVDFSKEIKKFQEVQSALNDLELLVGAMFK